MRSRTILVCSPLQLLREVAAVICIGMIAPGTAVWASDIQTTSTAAPQAPAAEPAVVKLPPDQLDSLVAPIALYPDPMLSQTLIASTYPLEVIQLKQWLDQNKNLSGKASGRRGGEAGLGPEYSVAGWATRGRQAVVREHQVDDGPGKRIPRAAG